VNLSRFANLVWKLTVWTTSLDAMSMIVTISWWEAAHSS
jgi:hypothetical protein